MSAGPPLGSTHPPSDTEDGPGDSVTCAEAPVLSWTQKPNPEHSISGRAGPSETMADAQSGLCWLSCQLLATAASIPVPVICVSGVASLLCGLHYLQRMLDRQTDLLSRASLVSRTDATSWAPSSGTPRGGLAEAKP